MIGYRFGGLQYAPLYIHHFRLLQPCRQLAAERFNLQYTDPSKITTVKDKLRYYRNKNALRQSLGLTKKEFGKRYGFHAHTVNQWEKDKIEILKSTWEKIIC